MLASGVLDDAAATRLSAQLLTLDAEGTGPIRLELQNLQAELPAALTLMGVLDVIRAEIQAFADHADPATTIGYFTRRKAAERNARLVDATNDLFTDITGRWAGPLAARERER